MHTRDKDESANKDRFEGDEKIWNQEDENGIIYESFFVKDYDASDDSDYEPDSDDVNDQLWDEDDEEDFEDEEDEDDS
ncbi:MAG TPA: hypothetical protein VLB50_11050 [Ignavibacteriaceae bacterium]|nr:hypothetical protein [Ignavibacteriaceae bacterium]